MTAPSVIARKAWAASWRPLATMLVLLAAAELAQRAGMLPVFVPSPSQVIGEAARNPRLVYENIGQTAWRAAVGYSIAAAVAITAGGVCAMFPPLARRVST